ncbi:putative lipoprotein lppW [Mycobacterium xenopi 3993]|nr:putative lipoprotein lppW [Mycobacterium xenopi 3993]
MRSRPPMLVVALAVTALVAGCEAKVYGAAAAKPAPPTPPGCAAGRSDRCAAVAGRAVALAGLRDRIRQAADQAASDGATISVALLDRATNQLIVNGDPQVVATASVAKLFIADELLLQESQGKATLSADERHTLDAMLQSSDDDAAEKFWNQAGGETIIRDVAARYGLAATQPPSDGRWWDTTTSTPDLIRYYQMLLDGSGGLPPERAKIIIDDLASSTPPASMATRSGSAYPTGSTPNRSR